jgi:hypothetical protein
MLRRAKGGNEYANNSENFQGDGQRGFTEPGVIIFPSP